MQMNRNKTEKRKNMWNGMVKPQDGWLVFDRSKNELAHERAPEEYEEDRLVSLVTG